MNKNYCPICNQAVNMETPLRFKIHGDGGRSAWWKCTNCGYEWRPRN